MDRFDGRLQVEGVHLAFGGVEALSDVTVQLQDAEILAIIGPNGAGKTCLINCISGFYRPSRGTIRFAGQDTTRLPTHRVARIGISRTFQNIQLYNGMTTLDNLMAGRHMYMDQHPVWSALFYGRALREEVRHRRVVEEIIDFLELQPIRKKVVGALPYGQRKRVDLGRALAQEPRLLLLDEPMAGMNVEEKEDMARFIIDVHERRRIPLVLVEHDMGVVMDIADRVCVLDFGRKIAEGTPDQIKHNPDVIKAYLGTSEDMPEADDS